MKEASKTLEIKMKQVLQLNWEIKMEKKLKNFKHLI